MGRLRMIPPPPPLPAGGVVLKAGRGHLPGNPITHPIEIAEILRELCGAEGYRIEGNELQALRWDLEGNARVIECYQIEQVG